MTDRGISTRWRPSILIRDGDARTQALRAALGGSTGLSESRWSALYVLQDFPVRSERFIEREIRGLCNLGVEVRIVTPPHGRVDMARLLVQRGANVNQQASLIGSSLVGDAIDGRCDCDPSICVTALSQPP